MALTNETVKTIYAGNGSTTVFAIPFDIVADDSAEVKVYVRDESVPTAVTETLQTEGVDYNLTGASPPSVPFATDVTFTTAPASTDKVLVVRNLTIRQLVDFIATSNFDVDSNEKALDRATALIQQNDEVSDRSVKLSKTDLGTFDPTLPVNIEASVDSTIIVNSSGTGWDIGPSAADVAAAQANAAAAAASAAAAATSETNAATSETNAATSATNAATSATNASTSETNAATSATNAATSETNAATSATAAAGSATSAATSATNAATSETNAATSATNANTSAVNAATSETNAGTSASNAATSATNAAASAVDAANAASASLWNDVSYKVFGDSPVSVVDADSGTLFVVDCSGGNVVINLPSIAVLTLTAPWAIGIKKSDSTTNTVTINPSGAETIDEVAAALVISNQSQVVTLVADADKTPDDWTTIITGTGLGAGGGGGFSYFNDASASEQNPGAETNDNGWQTYEDTGDGSPDDTTPADGTGGAPNITWTRTTVAAEIGRGVGGFKLAKDAVNRQGEGVNWGPEASELINIHPADRGKELNFGFLVKTTGAYVSDDIEIFVYDVTNAQLITVNATPENDGKIKATGGTFRQVSGRFFTQSTTTQIRFIIHIASTNASAYDVFFDDFSLGASSFFNGPIVSEWESFTPTFGGRTTDGTVTYATPDGVWRRVGDSMEMIVSTGVTTVTTSPTGGPTVTIPNGYQIDTAKATNFNGVKGVGRYYNGSVFIPMTAVYYNGHPNLSRVFFDSLDSTAIPSTLVAGHQIHAHIIVPISGWDAGALLSTQQANDQVIKVIASDTAGTSIAAAGTVVPYATETVDSHNAFSGGVFTAPRDGQYFVSAQIAFAANTFTNGNAVNTIIRKNGSNHKANSVRLLGGTAASLPIPNVVALVDLLKGDTVDIIIFHSEASNRPLTTNAVDNYLSIYSIPDFTHFGVNGVNELVQSIVADAAYSITADQWGDLTSIILTPGTWDLSAQAIFLSNGATTTGQVSLGISTTAGNSASGLTIGNNLFHDNKETASGSYSNLVVTRYTVTLNTTTTYYLKGKATTSITNLRVAPKISARRIS